VAQTVPELWQSIGEETGQFSANYRKHYLKAAGYESEESKSALIYLTCLSNRSLLISEPQKTGR